MISYKIILVENDDDEQSFMQEGFEKAGGFEVLALVPNGEGLITWLEKHPDQRPDLVLTDLNMPGMNGMDILQAFREHPFRKDIPVIITSTSSTQSIISKCIEAGAAFYIVKPETFIMYEPFVKDLHRLIGEKGLVKPAASETPTESEG